MNKQDYLKRLFDANWTLEEVEEFKAQSIEDHEQKQWLPYPENKPEESGPYLITFRYSTGHLETMIRAFIKNSQAFEGIDNKVIAFRPLPEAWKGEKP